MVQGIMKRLVWRKVFIATCICSFLWSDQAQVTTPPGQKPENAPTKKQPSYSHRKLPPAIKTPYQVQQEILLAEKNLIAAERMFIPWYTGPLITGSANNVPVGRVNVQPYLYFYLQYGKYRSDRSGQSIQNIYTINPLILAQTGISPWLDFTLLTQGYFRWQGSHSTVQFGDTSVTFGFQVIKETRLLPSVRLTLGESFPTGKYQHLNPNQDGIDGTGSGAFITNFGLNVSKIFWWYPLHPINFRFSGVYSVPDNRVPVHSFNSYGGGYGTVGKVSAGQIFNGDLGIEFSINQSWVIATDIVYACTQNSTFSGTKGVTATGEVASTGAPSSDNLSISPAIEYNVSENGGFIGGVWFSLTGRNSPEFVSIVLSYTYLF